MENSPVSSEHSTESVERCYFCKKNPAVPEASHPLKLYRMKNDLLVASVHNQVTIPIARCYACKKVHAGGNNWIVLLGILGTVVGGGAGLATMDDDSMGLLIFLTLLGLVIGLVAGKTIDSQIANKANILPIMPDSFFKHPEVLKYRREGFGFKMD